MKEVSCKVLNGFFQNLKRNRLPIAPFIAGSRYSLAHLQSKDERIEWSEFALLMGNAGTIWNKDELVELGGEFLRSPFLRWYQIIARLLFSTRELIHYTNTEAGGQMFTCVRAVERDLAFDTVEITLTLAEGCEISEPYFLVSQGAFKYMPCIMGLPPAELTVERQDRVSRYRMQFTPGGGALSGLRKLLQWPSTVFGAVRELRETNRVLQTRYEELEKTRDALALKSTQLETANRITTLIHGNLDLGHTMERVADALVTSGGFEYVQLALTIGAPYDLSRSGGVQPEGRHADLTVPVESRGKIIGEIDTWIPDGQSLRELQELLDKVMPSLSTTLDEALTYTMLQDSRLHLEQRVEARTAELSRATERIAHTLHEVTQAKQARDRIFADINHEIRTPLSIIKAAAAELKRGDEATSATLPPQSTIDWIEGRARSIDFASNRLLRIVNQLLDLAAGKEGKLTLQRTRFDLVKQLRTIVAAWVAVAEKERIEIVFTGPESLPVFLDQEKIDRSISNLMSNAIKYTPAGGRIELRLDGDGDELGITVVDSGPGLDDDFMRRAFGRFEKGKAPLRGGTGSGIGLSLVRELVELHGGRVAADNGPDGGARFRIVLSSGRDAGHDAAELRSPSYRTLDPHDYNVVAADRTLEIVQPAQPVEATILVAEDDPVLCESLGALLGRKYRVLLATDGASALALARKYLPDLLVSDVDMPVMDGIELLRQFQGIQELQMPSAILLTALSGLQERLIGLEAGAVDYVPKPFDPDEVLARVESQLALRRRALDAARRENLSSLGTMVKGLMHELRNPANGLVHAVKLLREILPAEALVKGSPVDELLEVAESCSSQIELMCVDMLGINGRGEPIRRAVPFINVVRRAAALVSGFLVDIELRQRLEYDGSLFCSEPLIAQVLANLLKNAAQAAGKGGWVGLSSRVEAGQLILEVGDSGPGVPPYLRQRIFEMFFTTRSSGEGSGLGLPMSRQIVERHGGVLEVRDSPTGTVFHVALPLGQLQLARSSATV